jgi:hypothetical protein
MAMVERFAINNDPSEIEKRFILVKLLVGVAGHNG